MKNEDDLFFVCTMIECVARTTHNKPKDIVAKISDSELIHELKVASVNHCLSFEQICDEWIEKFHIQMVNLKIYQSVNIMFRPKHQLAESIRH